RGRRATRTAGRGGFTDAMPYRRPGADGCGVAHSLAPGGVRVGPPPVGRAARTATVRRALPVARITFVNIRRGCPLMRVSAASGRGEGGPARTAEGGRGAP